MARQPERLGGLDQGRHPGQAGGPRVEEDGTGGLVVGGAEVAVGVLGGECDREVAAYRVLSAGVVAAVPPLLGEGAEHEEGGLGEGTGVQPVAVGVRGQELGQFVPALPRDTA
ncbi:hypothetical protein ACQPXS_44220 [Streptomyces sp. CA-142005]|uniref:hypothetical protein n=1 Tax=Streptomyces sp. CA-142005 TaxID=3240052 RepID=UPI003D8C8A3A